MTRKTFFSTLGLVVFSSLFLVLNQNIAHAQNNVWTVGNVKIISNTITGFFSKSSDKTKDKKWFVFIGSDASIYKMLVVDKNVNALYIDGQKIADDQISQHSAGFKPFLERILKNDELESAAKEFDSEIRSKDRKSEAIDKEIQKLENAEEKLEQLDEKSSTNLTNERAAIKAQRKRMSAIQRDYDRQSDDLSRQQERIENEQELLGLDAETDKILARITADLNSLGVVKGTNNLTFKLSNVELIVNGKRIAPDIYQSFKAKYVPESQTETGFLYRWKGNI